MNLGSLVTAAIQSPRNLMIIILNNDIYQSSGVSRWRNRDFTMRRCPWSRNRTDGDGRYSGSVRGKVSAFLAQDRLSFVCAAVESTRQNPAFRTPFGLPRSASSSSNDAGRTQPDLHCPRPPSPPRLAIRHRGKGHCYPKLFKHCDFRLVKTAKQAVSGKQMRNQKEQGMQHGQLISKVWTKGTSRPNSFQTPWLP